MKKKKHQSPFSSLRLKRTVFSLLIAFLLTGAIWIQNTLSEVRTPLSGSPAELYANQTDDDLTVAYQHAINSAKESILLIVYSLTDPAIISSLRHKSDEGINIRVICDAKASPFIDSKLGSKINCIRRFGPGLMHQKILVIDRKQTWIGSANMTTESLRMHGNLIAAMESEELAHAIIAKASTLKIEGREESFPHTDFKIGGQEIELWFLPDNKDAVTRLKTLICSAQKTIRVAMFTWTRNDLAQEIIDAANRGVDTEVVIDHYSGKGASSKIVKMLKRNGISVTLSRGGPLLHHKFLYVDNTILVNGSANWTKAAFTQNDDCFIVIHHLNEQQKNRMEAVWNVVKTSSMAVE